MFWVLLFILLADIARDYSLTGLILRGIVLVGINKFFGRVIFILLFLEVFTFFFLLGLFGLIQAQSLSFSAIYLFLASVALEARLGFGLLVALVRTQGHLDQIL